MKFSISLKQIESCKSSSSKYKNELVEKTKLCRARSKDEKNGPQSKKKQAKKKKKI